jgi:hypothetical protein
MKKNWGVSVISGLILMIGGIWSMFYWWSNGGKGYEGYGVFHNNSWLYGGLIVFFIGLIIFILGVIDSNKKTQ